MQSWFVRILLSTLGSALGDFLSKFLFEKYPKLTVAGSMTYGRLLEIIGLCIFIYCSGRSFLLFNESWIFLGLLGLLLIIRFIGNKLYYEGMKRLDVTFVAILFTFSTLISVLGGILFHNESVHLMKFIGIILIMGSIIALNIADLNIQVGSKKYIYYILLSAFIYGIVANIEKIVGLEFDPFVFRFWYSLCSVGLFIIFYPKDLKQDLAYTKELPFRWINAFTSVAFGLWNIGTLFAFKYGAEAGKVDAINNSAIFIIILLEIVILKNRDHLWLKILLSVLTFMGMLLLKME